MLEGESEADYGNLLLAVLDYFGEAQPWDVYLLSDVASASWEIQRLLQAGETLVGVYFRHLTQELLTQNPGKANIGSLVQSDRLISALRQAGFEPADISISTLKDLRGVLKQIDEEIDAAECRRRQTLKTLIKLRARATSAAYYEARSDEVCRAHQWKCA